MTRPARARVQVQDQVATDPAVQAIFDQLATFQEEVAAPVSPFGDAVVSPFGKAATASPFGTATASPFGSAAKASNAFVEIAAQAASPFGPTGSTAFMTRGSDAFAAKGSSAFARPRLRGHGRMTAYRVEVPPLPPGEPEFGSYWLPFCELLRCYEKTPEARDRLWTRGDGWNFTLAAEAQGYGCVEDIYNGHAAEREGHFPDEDDCCRNEEHRIIAFDAKTFDDTLVDCDCGDWPWGEDWKAIVPLMQEIREQALANAEWYLTRVRPDNFYRVAGYTSDQLYQLLKEHGDLVRPILDAVASGVHDQGLAAAFADGMARYHARAFGTAGALIDGVLTNIHEEDQLPRHPAVNLIFAALRQPTLWFIGFMGQRLPVLEEWYGTTHVTYHSALTRNPFTAGYVGWRSLWMIPTRSSTEILESDGAIIWGGDDEEAESNKRF